MNQKDNSPHLALSHERLAFMIENASEAQRYWNKTSLDERALHLRAFKEHLVSLSELEKQQLSEQVRSSPTDFLYHEFLPTLAAITQLDEFLPSLLPSQKKTESLHPFTRMKLLLLPVGTVLILDRSSSPLYLPTVTALHSIACGNGTILITDQPKSASYRVLSDIIEKLNLPPNLLQIAPISDMTLLPSPCANRRPQVFIQLIDSAPGEGAHFPLAQLGVPAYQCQGFTHSAFVALSDAPLDLLIPALKAELRILSNLKTARLSVWTHESLRETLCNSLPELLSARAPRAAASTHPTPRTHFCTFRSVNELKEFLWKEENTPIDLSIFSKNSTQCLSFAVDLPVSKISLNHPPRLSSHSLHLRPYLVKPSSGAEVTFTLPQILTREQRITQPFEMSIRLRSPFWDPPSESRIQLLRYLSELYRMSPFRRIRAVPNILWHFLHILKGER